MIEEQNIETWQIIKNKWLGVGFAWHGHGEKGQTTLVEHKSDQKAWLSARDFF